MTASPSSLNAKQDGGRIFIFFLLSALYFWDVLNSDNLLTERDLEVFFIPPRWFWVDSVLHEHTFPLWNPYFAFGHPLFATLQDGVLYPFSILYFILPFAVAFNYTIVLHFALAGTFMYLLMRAQDASPNAAFVAGVCFVFGGYFISIHSLLSTLLSVTWTPLFFLVYFIAVRKQSIAWSIGAGVVGCVMFLGGGIEVCYVVFTLALLLTLFPGLIFEPDFFPGLKKRLPYFGVFAAVFFGLSMVQILPFLELTGISVRSAGVSYEEASVWSLHPMDFVAFFIPDMYGYSVDLERYWTNQNWLKSIYLGSIPFLLAQFFFSTDTRKSRGFLLLCLFSFLLALGNNFPLHTLLFDYAPLFNKLRYPVKFIFLAIFIIAMSAGFGLDRLVTGIRTCEEKTRNLIKKILFLSFLSMIAFGGLNLFHYTVVAFAKKQGWGIENYNDIEINLFNIRRLLCFTGLFGLGVFLFARFPKKEVLFTGSLLLALTLDLFFAHHGFFNYMSVKNYFSESANIKFIRSDPSLFRIMVSPKTEKETEFIKSTGSNPGDFRREKVSSGLSLLHGIFDAQGALVTAQQRHRNILELILSQPKPDATNLLSMANVKYLVSRPKVKSPEYKLVHFHTPPPSSETEQSWEDKKTIKIYENLNVFPRAFFVPGCLTVAGEEPFKKIFSNKNFRPDRMLILEQTPAGFTCDGKTHYDASARQSVRFSLYKNNEIELEAETDRRELLFLSESHYPGWKAWIDGKPVDILRANYLFRAIPLEPGKHHIRMEYDPLSFKIGAGISLATLIACLGVLLRRNRNIKSATTPPCPDPFASA